MAEFLREIVTGLVMLAFMGPVVLLVAYWGGCHPVGDRFGFRLGGTDTPECAATFAHAEDYLADDRAS